MTAADATTVADAQRDARGAFDIAPRITYLDAATYGLPPRSTIAAMREALDAWAGGTADWVEDWDRPAEETRADYSPNNRGRHVLTQRADGKVQCVACNLCATVCPAGMALRRLL